MNFSKLIFALLVLIPSVFNAQVILTRNNCNPTIKDFLRNNPDKCLKNLKNTDTLSLPFFDDFSKPQIYPDNSLWIDNYAYINSSFGINPPSIGVATLDEYDETGAVYSHANNTSFISDYLTSKPIKLKIDAPYDTTVYLSFLYQSGGFGDLPEKKDSLILEFYSPIDTIWHSVWRVPGDTVVDFRKVIIHISDSIYLQDGFQFRFKNYASINLASNTNIRTANIDGWNLDWIYLNKSRSYTDTLLNDVCFIKNLKPFLKTYETVPWKHFQDNSSSLFVDSRFSTNFINYSNQTLNVPYVENVINCFTNQQTYYHLSGATNAEPDSINVINPKFFDNPFPFDNKDSAEFNLRALILTDTVSINKPFRWNDTVSFSQKFFNYYAYDDGSAEMGFGIDGNEAPNAKIALKFTTLKTDTLRAIQMYFNHTYQNANDDVYFKLTVWSNNNGKPGSILYQKEDCKVSHSYNKNGFFIYNFDTPLVLSGTFFIGWVQIGTVSLNIGYDIDRDSSPLTFFNSYGNWIQLLERGTVMMRPVFGKSYPVGIEEPLKTTHKLNIWPNPVSNILNIDASNFDTSIGNVDIFDLSGRLVLNLPIIQGKINISALENGIYLLRINTDSGIYSSKFIVNK